MNSMWVALDLSRIANQYEATHCQSPTPIYMKYDGIDGDVTAAGHEKWIEVLSYSWGMTQQGSHGAGGGGGAGKSSMQDFHFIHRVDKASPKLMSAVCQGRRIPWGILALTQEGEGDLSAPNRASDYLVIKLKEVVISSVQPGANADTDDLPLESVSFNFGSIEAEYIAPDGEVVRGSC